MRECLTTGQIAKAAGVAMRTVTKWMDSQALPGWRLPLCNDRRARTRDVIAFFQQYGIPTEGLLKFQKARVLILCSDPSLKTKIEMAMLGDDDYEYRILSDTFQLGYQAFSFAPTTVLLDLNYGDEYCLTMAKTLAGDARLAPLLCLFVARFDGPHWNVLPDECDYMYPRDFNGGDFKRRLDMHYRAVKTT